jgi:hypothetical protein
MTKGHSTILMVFFPFRILVAFCDHDAVTYRPTAAEVKNFTEYVRKAQKTHSQYSGGDIDHPPSPQAREKL